MQLVKHCQRLQRASDEQPKQGADDYPENQDQPACPPVCKECKGAEHAERRPEERADNQQRP